MRGKKRGGKEKGGEGYIKSRKGREGRSVNEGRGRKEGKGEKGGERLYKERSIKVRNIKRKRWVQGKVIKGEKKNKKLEKNKKN